MIAPSEKRSLPASQLYFRDMSRHALLDRQAEKTLARRFQKNNDRAALDTLIKSNLRLVVKIARDFSRGDSEVFPDLVQEGNVGLVQAAHKFDPSKNVKFSYYASFWIKARIYKYLIDNHRSVRIGTTQAQRKLFFNLQKTAAKLAGQGTEPSPETIAEHLQVSPKDVTDMQARLEAPDISLNAPLRGREDGERIDTLRSARPSAEEKYGRYQVRALFQKIMRQFRRHINKRERAILDQRLLAPNPDTLQTLGNRFGVSRERIRQVESRIIQKLRDFWLSKHADIKQYLHT
jgi:RNA polymerase sigma-32 factor